MKWYSGLPEEYEDCEVDSHGAIHVIAATKLFPDMEAITTILRRVRKEKNKALGAIVEDKSKLKDEWKWDPSIGTVKAWMPFPFEDDPAWFSCEQKMPEDIISPARFTSFDMIQVLVKYRVAGSSQIYVAPDARCYCDGKWMWTFDNRNICGWMPYPQYSESEGQGKEN